MAGDGRGRDGTGSGFSDRAPSPRAYPAPLALVRGPPFYILGFHTRRGQQDRIGRRHFRACLTASLPACIVTGGGVVLQVLPWSPPTDLVADPGWVSRFALCVCAGPWFRPLQLLHLDLCEGPWFGPLQLLRHQPPPGHQAGLVGPGHPTPDLASPRRLELHQDQDRRCSLEAKRQPFTIKR